MIAILLSIAATIVAAISIGVIGNIYDVSPTVCYVCRLMVALYGFTSVVLMFMLAYRYTL
jgi:hypothetical protein